ncbi:hypothetical protein CLF_105217, partial [Clonorchis sinensis]
MTAERAQNSLRILLFLLSFKDPDFRILLKLNFIEHQFREAKDTGNLKTYLQQAVCSQIEEKSSWFKQCSLERFHLQSEHVDVVILLKVSLSETGYDVLGNLRSHNVRSFTTNRHLSVIFGHCASAVDIAEEEMRGGEILVGFGVNRMYRNAREADGLEASVYIEDFKQKDVIALLPLEASESILSKRQKLSDKLRDKVRDLTVTAEELLVFDTLSVVQASMTMVSLLPATSLDHKEYWNLPLKSVIDLIGNPGLCEANFKLPIYTDLGQNSEHCGPILHAEVAHLSNQEYLDDFYHSNFYELTCVHTLHPFATKATKVHGILADVWLRAYFLIRETFVCSVLERYVNGEGRLQGLLRIVMLRSTITDELQSYTPTNLALLGLFARLRPQLVYTTYIHESRSTYDYIRDSDDSSHF